MPASSGPAFDLPTDSARLGNFDDGASFKVSPAVAKVLAPLASLKFTVALLGMAVFVVLAGTLAQVDRDIWECVRLYFRSFVAFYEFQIFFPPAFFPSGEPPKMEFTIGGTTFRGFWFLGGWSVGVLMTLNLLAAHGLRFKPQSKGGRLWAGLGVMALGALAVWAVIAGGNDKSGIQEDAWFTTTLFWDQIRWMASFIGIDDSGMRILWQLAKATAAAAVLWGGCALVFRKRAGVVLLHLGVLLMMASELQVGLTAVEGQMHIKEGETVDFVKDIRVMELAVVDPSPDDHDDVTVVPQGKLTTGERISSEHLPFDIELARGRLDMQHDFGLPVPAHVAKTSSAGDSSDTAGEERLLYFRNAQFPSELKPGEKPRATSGLGLQYTVHEAVASAGADSDSQVDYAACWVRCLKRGTDEPLATLLLSAHVSEGMEKPEILELDGKRYELALRFKRSYKPYTINLIDVRKDDYVGTNTPKNYSSEVRIVDPSRTVDREVKIWMNNPLRFAGETFYQSSYNMIQGREMTGLQVVTNEGWMIPYVACMIVVVGMLAHFVGTLTRFLNKRSDDFQRQISKTVANVKNVPQFGREKLPQPKSPAVAIEIATPADSHRAVNIGIPAAAIGLAACYILYTLVGSTRSSTEFDLYAFGKLPVAFEGRVKPMDTLARNTLQVVSDKESYYDHEHKKQLAVRWLLDTIAGREEALEHEVFRIESLDVQAKLGLKARAHYRYALKELAAAGEIFDREFQRIDEKQKKHEKLDLYDRKVTELGRRLRAMRRVREAFHEVAYPPLPTPEQLSDRALAMQVLNRLDEGKQVDELVEANGCPRAIPSEKDQWQAFAKAWNADYKQRLLAIADPSAFQAPEANRALDHWRSILKAWRDQDAPKFNSEVREYQAWLEGQRPHEADFTKLSFETYFNYLAPFTTSMVLYVGVFGLAALSWLFLPQPLGRAALGIAVLAFALHTFALVARMYISGRPPVTNLYSSAVFIGWGTVALGIVFERIFKTSLGNIVGAMAGFTTLVIAGWLPIRTGLMTGDSDTFTVLQAVLDTNFWLATHVVCITFGYATTYFAGLMAMFYLLFGVFTPALNPKLERDLLRMIYGTLCFSILFSFFGTVLGGLWADDSWGRFWGWDPKENGALIIVLWNALVLHARWDGMAKERGMAALAVLGNIAVSWSWFGVNELGRGLHSYGRTEGVMELLGIFALSQIVIACLGLLPEDWWWSYRTNKLRGGKTAEG